VHQQFSDQAAAYVLGALTPDERQAFEARMGDVAAWFNLVAAQISLELAVGETN